MSALKLHGRIERFGKKGATQADIGEHLMAVKWLGNAGSHQGEALTRADTEMAFDQIEHILAEVYGRRTESLKAAAKAINKKGGSIVRKSTRR